MKYRSGETAREGDRVTVTHPVENANAIHPSGLKGGEIGVVTVVGPATGLVMIREGNGDRAVCYPDELTKR